MLFNNTVHPTDTSCYLPFIEEAARAWGREAGGVRAPGRQSRISIPMQLNPKHRPFALWETSLSLQASGTHSFGVNRKQLIVRCNCVQTRGGAEGRAMHGPPGGRSTLSQSARGVSLGCFPQTASSSRLRSCSNRGHCQPMGDRTICLKQAVRGFRVAGWPLGHPKW